MGTTKTAEGYLVISRPGGALKIKTLEVGDTMEDGTIFAGVSPDTGRNMFVTPKDASAVLNWKAAMKYAAELDANGHKDWRLPTIAELHVLYQNRNKGALKDSFDTGDFTPSNWYWSSTENPPPTRGAWMERFSDSQRHRTWKGLDASVRPVRLEPRP
jgi:hypothetical protein